MMSHIQDITHNLLFLSCLMSLCLSVPPAQHNTFIKCPLHHSSALHQHLAELCSAWSIYSGWHFTVGKEISEVAHLSVAESFI